MEIQEITHKETASPSRRPVFGYVLAFFFAAAAFFSGIQVGSMHVGPNGLGVAAFFASPSAPKEGVDLSLFWRVWHAVDERFVGASSTPLTDEEKMWGAIEGLVGTYEDPYTVFLPPQEAKMFEDDISGEFGGVGMEVGMKKGLITVIAPLPDTPAQRAGLLPGDVIVRIDDTSTERMSVDEAVMRIRGEKGSTVRLTYFREGKEGTEEVAVVRDTINIPTIKNEEKDGVFIIRLYNFSQNSDMVMQDALRAFGRSGKDKLVLDLRGNPGGYLQSSVAIASYFLPPGKVVVRENFGEGKEERLYRSVGRDLRLRPFKIVVLVDEGSASASEILAGALKEHGVATVIGEPTFGKGSVQELVTLPGGASLKVTVARWLTPNGVSISEGGLKPDIEVPLTTEDRENDRDPQLDEAISFLKR